MYTNQSGAIAPVECLKEGWAAIKDQYWLILGITFVAMIIGGAVPIILIGPMMCGLYLCLLQRLRGEPVQFEQLFKGFDYFVPALIAAVIQTVPVFAFLFGGYIVGFVVFFATIASGGMQHDEPPPAAFFVFIFIFVLVMIVVSLLLHVFFVFAYPLVVDRKLSGLEAVKTSFRAASQNFGGLVGLALLNVGLGIVGLLCCYVGAFLVMPISFASYVVAYRQVFPAMPDQPGFATPPPPPSSWAA